MKMMGRSMQTVNLRLPAQAEFLDVARLSLYGIAARMGFEYEDIEDMKVAVSEACNNVILHAYREQEGMIDIQFEIGPNELLIRVKDQGGSFDVENTLRNRVDPQCQDDLEEVQPGGLGIYLMQALMDEVQVTGGTGTEVMLKKMLK